MTYPMRYSLLLGVLLCVVAAIGAADNGDVGRMAEFTRLEQLWNDAHLRSDADALDALWADDFVAIVPGMSPMEKESALSFARSGRMNFSRYETSDLRIRVFGEAAVVSGKLFRSRTLAGTERDDRW